MPIHSRAYYQYVERDSTKISPLWKASHAVIFIAIALNSFYSAYIFHEIFQSFRLRCVLFARPLLSLEDVQYHDSTTTENFYVSYDNESNSLAPVKAMKKMALQQDVTLDIASNSTEEDITVVPWSKPRGGTNVTFRNGEYWVSNSTLKARVILNFRGTTFTNVAVCNSVLFVPLATLIIATFAAVMTIICGRGGRGFRSEIFRQSWIYVYPVLITSILMLVMTSIVANVLYRGAHLFCSHFKTYTGSERCSKEINYFTKRQEKIGNDNFFELYQVCMSAFCIGIVLWTLQLLLCILRVFCAVDFQLNIITISCKRRRSLARHEEAHVAEYLHKYPHLQRAKVSFEHTEDLPVPMYQPPSMPKESTSRKTQKKVTFAVDSDTDDSSSSAKVHKAVTKSYKGLRQVDDKDDDVKKKGGSSKTSQV